MITATATEVQNNFGKYLSMVQNGDEIIVLKNGKQVARLISNEQCVSSITKSLVGVLSNNYDDKEIRAERKRKYESAD